MRAVQTGAVLGTQKSPKKWIIVPVCLVIVIIVDIVAMATLKWTQVTVTTNEAFGPILDTVDLGLLNFKEGDNFPVPIVYCTEEECRDKFCSLTSSQCTEVCLRERLFVTENNGSHGAHKDALRTHSSILVLQSHRVL